jgi:hypothetical protein
MSNCGFIEMFQIVEFVVLTLSFAQRSGPAPGCVDMGSMRVV